MLIGTAIFLVINNGVLYLMSDRLSPGQLILFASLNALGTVWLDQWLQR